MRFLGAVVLLFFAFAWVEPPLVANQDQKIPTPVVPKERDNELRKLYSKELAAKDKAAVEKLLKDALDTKDEPVTQFQLLILAYQKAVEIFDFSGAFRVSDELGRRYSDVNPTGLRARALDEARKRKPKAELLEDLVNGDLEFAIFEMDLGQQNSAHFDEAVKAAKNAASGAKFIKSRFLEDKAEAIQKYASDLSKNKDDAFSQAKFKYFVLGDSSEEVFMALSNGSDARLKRVAGLQVVGGKAAQNYYEFADVAYEAANESARLGFERLKLLNDSRNFYERVLSEATGAEKTKYERDEKLKKRKAEVEAKLLQYGGGSNALGIDLLSIIDPAQDKGTGEWRREGFALVSSEKRATSMLRIPYSPPAEYDLSVTVETREGLDTILIGLTKDNARFAAQIDGYPPSYVSGIEMIDGKNIAANGTAYQGKLLKARKASTIVCSVRNGGVTVSVDGKKISEYKGTFSKLTERGDYSPPNHGGLYITVWDTAAVLNRLSLIPVSGGQGKRLR